MTRLTMTLAAIKSYFTITVLAIITAGVITPSHAQDVSFHVYQYGTGPVVIVAGATTDQVPQFNPAWCQMQPGTLIATRDYWIPYPAGWPLYDAGINWVVADYAMMWEGLPLYYQFDYDADGHVSDSDLIYFEQEYGAKWDLSDYSCMGLIYDDRRRDE